MSFVITYPYMNSKKKYYICVLIAGILYDIVYTGTPFINTLLFLLFALLIRYFFKYINNNVVSSLVISGVIIILYRVIIYMFLNMIGYIVFDPNDLWITIYSSFITNAVYITIIHIILYRIRNKKRKKRYSTNVRKNY